MTNLPTKRPVAYPSDQSPSRIRRLRPPAIACARLSRRRHGAARDGRGGEEAQPQKLTHPARAHASQRAGCGARARRPGRGAASGALGGRGRPAGHRLGARRRHPALIRAPGRGVRDADVRAAVRRGRARRPARAADARQRGRGSLPCRLPAAGSHARAARSHRGGAAHGRASQRRLSGPRRCCRRPGVPRRLARHPGRHPRHSASERWRRQQRRRR